MPDLLLCERCTFSQNTAFPWHQTPSEVLLMCISPASLHFPHITNKVTLGFLNLWWSVPAWSVPYHHQRSFWRNEIRHPFIHYLKIVFYLPCILMRKKQRKQNKPILEGLKMFCRMELKVFLTGCLHFLFLLIYHDVNVHWKSSFILFHVQRDDVDDSDDIDILPWFIIGWI